MGDILVLDEIRLAKMQRLLQAGYNPPYNLIGFNSFSSIIEENSWIGSNGERTERIVLIQGRIQSIRSHGKITFITLLNRSGEHLQVSANEKDFKNYQVLSNLDVGDWIAVRGPLFKTKRGELTVAMQEFYLLSKCLQATPDPQHGLSVENRLRRPWYYLRFDEASRQHLIHRAIIKRTIRRIMNVGDFIEIDTPTLSQNYGGAAAKPFTTRCNTINQDLFLSVAPEPYLKEAIVGGFERVYTIARNFRNEDADTTHNPEFEMLECYAIGWDYANMASLLENLVQEACIAVHGKPVVNFRGVEVNFAKWRRVTMDAVVREHFKIATDDDMGIIDIFRNEIGKDAPALPMAINELFERFVQSTLIQPTIVMDYPEEISPLTRKHRSGRGLVERFEAFVNGVEIANAYSELNDAVEQEKRLREQRSVDSPYPIDEDFVDAMYVGLPTAGGLGLGIDRIVMLISGTSAIRDVLLSPIVARRKDL